jgi:hypothetical protein
VKRTPNTFIFLKRLGMFSSSKGSVPQRRAYNITPQLHTSTSGPAYNFPEITYKINKSTNNAEINLKVKPIQGTTVFYMKKKGVFFLSIKCL